jgi:cytosolic carboxypeptidase protein 2/3
MDPQIYTPVDENDRTLMFESRFESGNLYLAQKVADTEYNLLMQNDVNTNGHTQWFFFRVQNTRAGQRVKFNLLNYTKPDSLFNYGMKVTIYSERAAEEKKVGWFKGGEDISYFQNGIRKDVLYSSKSFYTATFTHKFKYSGDSVYFAYSQPYTYTDLKADLLAIEQDPDRSQFVTTKLLCQTLQGTHCEYLTITSKRKGTAAPEINQRKGVIISARVHPGETVGSHMMKGVLDFLTDPLNQEA